MSIDDICGNNMLEYNKLHIYTLSSLSYYKNYNEIEISIDSDTITDYNEKEINEINFDGQLKKMHISCIQINKNMHNYTDTNLYKMIETIFLNIPENLESLTLYDVIFPINLMPKRLINFKYCHSYFHDNDYFSMLLHNLPSSLVEFYINYPNIELDDYLNILPIGLKKLELGCKKGNNLCNLPNNLEELILYFHGNDNIINITNLPNNLYRLQINNILCSLVFNELPPNLKEIIINSYALAYEPKYTFNQSITNNILLVICHNTQVDKIVTMHYKLPDDINKFK